MNRVINVHVGAEIPVLDGVLYVRSINVANLIYCDHFIVTEAGDLESAGEMRLTAEEVAHEVKAIDGLNHKVIFD